MFYVGLSCLILLDLEAVFGSKSDTPARAKNLNEMILKISENVKEFR